MIKQLIHISLMFQHFFLYFEKDNVTFIVQIYIISLQKKEEERIIIFVVLTRDPQVGFTNPTIHIFSVNLFYHYSFKNIFLILCMLGEYNKYHV